MTMREHLSPHTLLLQQGPDRVLLYQSLLRKGILTNLSSISFLFFHLADSTPKQEFNLKFKDLTGFSLSNCLLDNPNGISNDFFVDLEDATIEIFLEKLRDLDLLVKDNSYQDKLGKKTTIFDDNHVGNFHQQIGRHLLSQRADSRQWWIDQKFTNNLARPTDTPYLWVQDNFIKEQFNTDLTGQSWLDFGCGIGYFAQYFSRQNANVVGVDPSLEYIEIARDRFSNNGEIEYVVSDFDRSGELDISIDRTFDAIFMSDVLLYYFEPYLPLKHSAVDLLKALKGRLNENGRIYIIDPHGCFHLQPWINNADPFLVCMEYRYRKFRVTPSLEEISKALEKAGLLIRRVRELYSNSPNTPSTQAAIVTKNFPMWWFFEVTSD